MFLKGCGGVKGAELGSHAFTQNSYQGYDKLFAD